MSQNPTIYNVARRVSTEQAANIPVQMDDKLLLLDPNENPFTLLTTQVPKRKVGNDEFQWHDDEIVPEHSTLASNSSAITVDNTGTWTVASGHAERFAPWDIVKNMNTGAWGQVTAINTSTDALTVDAHVAIGAGTTGDVIQRLGNSMEEGGGIPLAKSTAHTARTNYIQVFSDPVRFSEMAMKSADYFGGFGADYARQHKKALIQHARNIEWAFLMNEAPAQYTADGGITDPADEGNTLGYMMGLKYFIETYSPADNNKTEVDLTETEFYDWLEPCFEFGSSSKWLFAAPKLLRALMEWNKGEIRFQASSKNQTLGMKFAEIVTPHGMVKLVQHKMLKARAAGHDHFNFLVDFADEQIKYVYFNDLDTKVYRDQVKTGLHQQVDEARTYCSSQYRLAEKHGILKFQTFS